MKREEDQGREKNKWHQVCPEREDSALTLRILQVRSCSTMLQFIALAESKTVSTLERPTKDLKERRRVEERETILLTD